MYLRPVILFVLQPVLLLMNLPLLQSVTHPPFSHSFITLCIMSTVTLKLFLCVVCVVTNADTVPAVTYAGQSDLFPSLRVLMFCCGSLGKFDGCITADSLHKGYYVLSEAVTTV